MRLLARRAKPGPTLDRGSFLWVAAAVVAALLPVLPGFPIWLSVLLGAIVVLGVGLQLRAVQLPPVIRLPLIMGVAVAAMVASGFSVSQDTGAALLSAMLASKLLETGSVRDGRSACSCGSLVVFDKLLCLLNMRVF